MENDIKVKSFHIMGIKNPFVQIEIQAKDKEFVLRVDEEKKDFQITKGDQIYILTTALPKKSHKISLYYLKKKEEIFLMAKTNTFLRRVFYKVCECFQKFFSFFGAILVTLGKGIHYFWKEYHFLVPPKLWGKFWKDFKVRVRQRGVKSYYNPFILAEYHKWILESEEKTVIKNLHYNPLISVLVPVYNIKREFLEKCILSVLNQSYENFELCMVDDCSTLEETKETLKEWAQKDSRIHVCFRKENGHISKTSNDALKMAKGEFVALLDNDDELTKDALYEVAKVLNEDRTLDFIYSDEDKIDAKGERMYPHFKPDWSPDTLLSLNYICHLAVLRKSIVEKVGGFTVGLEGAQDHDLFLKVTEVTNKIYHIPKILYHWRMIEGSTSMKIESKSYALDKGKIAIENALKRRKIDAFVVRDGESGYYIVQYEFKKEPSVSIIIPTKDYVSTLKTCVDSLISKTDYKNYEIIIMNNNSVEKETFEFFKEYQKKYKNLKVWDANFEFNYSKINNIAIEKTKSDYVVLLNNDTEIISRNWLKTMIGYASQSHIGAVGAKLLYPDETVQHGGVILGFGGVASHAYIGKSRNDLGMYGRLKVPYDYSAVTAACLAISRKKYLEVGGLEEDLKVAYNDIDFNLKLLQKGYFNVLLPQIELYHFESKTRGYDTTTEKFKRFQLEEKYMYDKWKDALENDRFYNKNLSKKGSFMLKKK